MQILVVACILRLMKLTSLSVYFSYYSLKPILIMLKKIAHEKHTEAELQWKGLFIPERTTSLILDILDNNIAELCRRVLTCACGRHISSLTQCVRVYLSVGPIVCALLQVSWTDRATIGSQFFPYCSQVRTLAMGPTLQFVSPIFQTSFHCLFFFMDILCPGLTNGVPILFLYS